MMQGSIALLKGNAVKIRNSTRCCEAHCWLPVVRKDRKAIQIFYLQPLANRLGRRKDWDKSEDLPAKEKSCAFGIKAMVDMTSLLFPA